MWAVALVDARGVMPVEKTVYIGGNVGAQVMLGTLGEFMGIDFDGVTAVYDGESLYVDFPPSFSLYDGILESVIQTFRANDYTGIYDLYYSVDGGEATLYAREENPGGEESGLLSNDDAVGYALNLAYGEMGDGEELYGEHRGYLTEGGVRCHEVYIRGGEDGPVLYRFAIGLNAERVFVYDVYKGKYNPY